MAYSPFVKVLFLFKAIMMKGEPGEAKGLKQGTKGIHTKKRAEENEMPNTFYQNFIGFYRYKKECAL